MRTLLILVAGTFALTGCKAPERARPANVPADAVWAGREGKGNFISCGYGARREQIPCTVYNDRTGAVEAEGRFVLTGIQRNTSPDSFRYSWFDGKRIYLTDGSVLNPSESTDPGGARSQPQGPNAAPETPPVTPDKPAAE